MKLKPEKDRALAKLAASSIDAFLQISESAKDALRTRQPTENPAPISNNAWQPSDADRNLMKIQSEISRDLLALTREPAIARVDVIDENDEPQTYYICRGTPTSNCQDIILASYRSPIGRLASIPAGDGIELRLPRGTKYYDIEQRAHYNPRHNRNEWDSESTEIDSMKIGKLTVSSLRRLINLFQSENDLKQRSEAQDSAEIPATDDELEELLGYTSDDETLRPGFRKNLIQKMHLRDQPILDRYQDEIFRIPIDSSLLLLGPPGTGKTTTLIRRLGQKIDYEFLSPREKTVVSRTFGHDIDKFRTSWVMFTPSELLKLYVKEAFNKEGIPAPDERITTWSDMRHTLAQHSFPILRSSRNKSGLIFRQDSKNLDHNTERNMIPWLSDFEEYNERGFWLELEASVKNAERAVAQFTKQNALLVRQKETARQKADLRRYLNIQELLEPEKKGGVEPDISAVLVNLRRTVAERTLPTFEQNLNHLISFSTNAREEITKIIDATYNLLKNNDPQLERNFARFLATMTGDQDPDEPDDEGRSTNPITKTARERIRLEYDRAVRAAALACARGVSPGQNTRSGKIVQWLGNHMMPDAGLMHIGFYFELQSELRKLMKPVIRYVDGTPTRYREFRKLRAKEGLWYTAYSGETNDSSGLEVDLVLMTMLRAAKNLASEAADVQRKKESGRDILVERLAELQRFQVLIDEVSDFSPIQLAIMSNLAHPNSRSIFACGDIHQRLTSWGVRRTADFAWAVPNIDVQEVSIAYRQSRQLHDLAFRIRKMVDPNAAQPKLPDDVDNENVQPALVENVKEKRDVAEWLAERIREIDHRLHCVPSIAVLVNSEVLVRELAEELSAALAEDNIRVMSCPDGQVRGNEAAVRVFNAAHIKGLEFEAVFFVYIDEMSVSDDDVFLNYIYVGATRAASFLGIVCRETLPKRLSSIKELFVSCWR